MELAHPADSLPAQQGGNGAGTLREVVHGAHSQTRTDIADKAEGF